MKALRLSVWGLACVLLAGPLQAQALGQPLTVQAEADTYVRNQLSVQARGNFGCERVFEVSTGRELPGDPDHSRSLIRFDVSSIPLAFQSAVLELTVHEFYNPAPPTVFTVDVHRIAGPWDEGRGDMWVPIPPGCYGVDPWQWPPGASWVTWDSQPPFDPTAVATAQAVQGTHVKGSVIRWDISSLVRDWVDGTFPNHGLLLRDVTTGGPYFRSLLLGAREGRLFEPWYPPGDPVDGPRLVVTFADLTPPEITCAAADTNWHSVNISLACTAADSESGLADPTDASFSLTTHVTVGDESANAFTDSRTVCDLEDNCVTAGPIGGNMVDLKAPWIGAAATTSPNAAGWYRADVIVRFTCTDAGSGIPAGACPADQTLSAEGSSIASVAETVTDAVGHTSGPSNVVTVKIDKTAPTLNPVVSPNPVVLNGVATVTSGAADPLSGLASQSCGATDTTSVGAKVVTCTATDHAGNIGSASAIYRVVYAWTGFFQPVDNLPTLNQVKAGSAIPVKFSLGGNQGLSIFAAGYPVSRAIACGSGEVLDDIEQTVTAGGSSLNYDSASGQYTYVWKTDKAWAGTCRQLVVKLTDGNEFVANFRLK